jgi:excisionase family DNA binding protein
MPMTNKLLGEFFTMKEVAQRLGVHVATIQRWIKEDGMPSMHCGYSVRIFSVHLAQWLDDNWEFDEGRGWDLSAGREEWAARQRLYRMELKKKEEAEIVDIEAFIKEFATVFARVARQRDLDAQWAADVERAGPIIGQIVTGPQLAEYLKVSRLDVQLLSQRGELPTFKAGKRHNSPWLCSIPILERWIVERTEESMGVLIDDLLSPIEDRPGG